MAIGEFTEFQKMTDLEN